MNTLSLNSIGKINKFASPEETNEMTLTSSALAFFTDFTLTEPLVIESSLSAVDTMQLMKKSHVRLKLVLDENGDLLGIVSADDLLERKIVQKLGKGDIRQDLSVTDFMAPTDKLRVLEYSDVKKSNIAQVIQTLKNSGQQHCLVVDSDAALIRGLFSVSDISRKLKINIDVQDQPSFSKLASKLD
jgi:CBS domain containing-hemolysin-like protein